MSPAQGKPPDGQRPDSLRGIPDWLVQSLGKRADATTTPSSTVSPAVPTRAGTRAVAAQDARTATPTPVPASATVTRRATATTAKVSAATAPHVANKTPVVAPRPPAKKAPAAVPPPRATKARTKTSPALTAGIAPPAAVPTRAENSATPAPPVTANTVRPRGGLPPASDVPQQFAGPVQWFSNGLDRQRRAAVYALLTSWTGLVIALWAGVVGLFVGGLVGAGIATKAGSLGAVGHSVGVLSVIAAAVAGAVTFCGGFYAVVLFNNPLQFVGSLLTGAIFAVIIVAITAYFEADLLRVRGYRRPTRDEVRTIALHVQAIGTAMQLSAYPRFVVSDSANPGAWTHMRHIVVTTGLIDVLEPDQLRAVLAHEMHHWRSGDVVALRFVWACGWPVVLMFNLGTWLSGVRPGDPSSRATMPRTLLGIVGWALLWPAWIITKLIIAPTVASRSRQQEYEADRVAARMGLSESLIGALRTIAMFEGGRTGWEAVMTATHPPTALRIEALQQRQPDDVDYQEGPLGRLTLHMNE